MDSRDLVARQKQKLKAICYLGGLPRYTLKTEFNSRYTWVSLYYKGEFVDDVHLYIRNTRGW